MAFKNLKEDLDSLFSEYTEWELDSINQDSSLADFGSFLRRSGSDSFLRWSLQREINRKDPTYKAKERSKNKISMTERRKDPVYRAKELEQQRIYRYNKKMKG